MQIHSIICSLVLSLVAFTNAFTQKLQSGFSYWEHDYYDSNTKEKYPSKCDCDYIEETIQLESDSTFELTVQKGRLDPKYSHVEGKWNIHNDTVIYLSGKYTDGLFIGGTYSTTLKIRTHLLSDEKTIQYQELYDGYRCWKGFGNFLSEKKKK